MIFRILCALFMIMNTFSFVQIKNLKNNFRVCQNADSTKLAAGNSLIIWDCDGVLVDSEALLKQGEVEALARAGIEVTADDCVRMFSGYSPDSAAVNFLEQMKRPLPDNFIRDQIEGSLDLFRRRLQPLMKNTIHTLHSRNAIMCVASGSPKNRVELCLEVADMKKCFPDGTVFTRELVKKGKPAPDLFLYAADKMGYTPNNCIVVEDSAAGIEAALNANMKVIGYLGGGHAQSEWYRKAIMKYDIPFLYTQESVLESLVKYL
eukprot:gene9770-20314_t